MTSGGATANDGPGTPLTAAGVRIESGAKPIPGRYFVVLNKVTEGEYSISSVLPPPAPPALQSGKEMLVFDEALSVVQPAYQSFDVNKSSGNFRCSSSFLAKNKDYTPCRSELSKAVDLNIGTNIAGAVLTGGVTVITGARFWEARTDESLLQRIVAQPGFMEQVRRDAAGIAGERSLQIYRQDFQRIASAAAADAFVKRYAQEDPDKLVPKAREKQRLLQYREDFARSGSIAELRAFTTRYASWDPEGLVTSARQRQRELAAEEAKRDAEVKRVAVFKGNLKAGTQSNCGRVTSLRNGTATVAGITGSLQASELMPPGYPCQATTADVAAANREERDAQGRKIIRGPVGTGFYNNVHIISGSVGIRGDQVSVMNSVIEAPVCISTSGMGLRVSGSDLLCRLCVEFTGSTVMDNQIIGNRCAGQLSNHPDFQ